jgi:hypothetical protein
MPPPRRSRTGLIVGISVGVAAVVILAVVGGATLYYLRAGQNVASAPPTTTAALPSPTTTAALPSPTPQETVLFQDALTSGTNTLFPFQPQDGSPCNCGCYAAGGYEVSGAVCFWTAGALTDANVSIDVRAINASPHDTFGIALRHWGNGTGPGNFYFFEIDSNSNWDFVKSATNSGGTPIVDTTQNAAIKGGLNVTNTLLVRAKGSHFDFYINGTKVGQADDSTYPSGPLGLSAWTNRLSTATTAPQAVFNNIKVTTSP